MTADVSAARQWLDRVDERREAAWDELAGLCDGTRQWRMRVPVDPADSDEAFGAALGDLQRVRDALGRVLDLADELKDRQARTTVEAAHCLAEDLGQRRYQRLIGRASAYGVVADELLAAVAAASKEGRDA